MNPKADSRLSYVCPQSGLRPAGHQAVLHGSARDADRVVRRQGQNLRAALLRAGRLPNGLRCVWLLLLFRQTPPAERPGNLGSIRFSGTHVHNAHTSYTINTTRAHNAHTSYTINTTRAHNNAHKSYTINTTRVHNNAHTLHN